MTINKLSLHQAILTQLETLVDEIKLAADQAHQTATHEENKAENKYDTLGLEAAYLAHGQSKRVQEALANVQHFRQLPIRAFAEEHNIQLGALVEILSLTGKTRWVFLAPIAGGMECHYEDKRIMLITTASPLGKALLHRKVGDEVHINQGQSPVVYEIISLC